MTSINYHPLLNLWGLTNPVGWGSCLSADLMMGLPVTEDLYSIFSKEKEHEEKEKESQRGAQEQVSMLVQTYMQLLLLDDEKFHGGWALINCDPRLVLEWCWSGVGVGVVFM